jgi:hypothetical protein
MVVLLRGNEVNDEGVRMELLEASDFRRIGSDEDGLWLGWSLGLDPL